MLINHASFYSHPTAGFHDNGRPDLDGVAGVRMVARQYIGVEYRGKNAHAGGNPWAGVNALDSFVAAYNNISLLRQQMAPDERIHNVLLNSEQTVNVIPAYAKAAYQTRSSTLKGLTVLTEKVTNCIKAAALATGCEVKIQKYATPIMEVILPRIWESLLIIYVSIAMHTMLILY